MDNDFTQDTGYVPPQGVDTSNISNNPFLASMLAGAYGNPSGYRQTGPVERMMGMFARRQAAEAEAPMLQQMNGQIQNDMANGSTMEQAMLNAFKKNPTFMLQHPELMENAGKLRSAFAPPTGYTSNPGGGYTPNQAKIEYPTDANGNQYVKITQPNGQVNMQHVADKYKIMQGQDGSIYGINQADPGDFKVVHQGAGNPKDVLPGYDKDGNIVLINKNTGKMTPVTDKDGQPVQGTTGTGKTAQPKNFTNAEQHQLEYGPALYSNLKDMYDMSTATGTVSGIVQRLSAKYGGINDPAMMWQAAHSQAEANLAGLGSGGRMSVTALKQMLDTLPKDYQAARYSKGAVIPMAMQNLVDTAQTGLSLIESEGKKIPQGTLDKFADFGVYPDSQKDKDPMMKLRADPNSVSDDELLHMSQYQAAMRPEDRQRLKMELTTRQAKVLAAQNKTGNQAGVPQAIPPVQ